MSALVAFRNVLASKDIRQLIDNFFSLAALKVFNLVLPFVTLPYLIKTLGFEQYGVIVVALALIQYFQAITDYGFNLSATRDIARHRHSKRQLSFIYSKVMTTKLFLLAISIGFILPIIFFTPQFQADQTVFLLTALVLFGHTLFPEWFFRGVEKMRYITILDLSIKLSFTAGVFVFIHKPDDYWVYPLLNGIGYCVVAVVAHRLVYRNFSVNFLSVGVRQVKQTLKKGFPLFVNQFAPNLYNNTTGFVIGLVLGNYSAGLFGAIRQVVNLLAVFNSVVISVFFPFLNRNPCRFSIFSKLYLSLFLVVILFFSMFQSFLFNLFGIFDKHSTFIFFLLVFGVFCTAIYNVYSACYLIRIKKDVLVMKMVFVLSLLGFVLSVVMINLLGIVGGALSIFLTQFFLAAISFFFYFKYRSFRF